MKDRVHAILGVYGVYDPAVVMNPSQLQTIARHLKDEIDDAEAAHRAARDAERLRQEARQRQNVRQ
jgi:acyl-CoA reductase-like NAD-dependent aldehyde dehydrogenase